MSKIEVTEKLVMKLQELQKKISLMESCTGGGIANEITNICGASGVFEFCAVTYSNDYKIKMGVNCNVIDKYGVYSMETAREMSIAISEFTGSDYGIGVTGKLNCLDIGNRGGLNNMVYAGIYDRVSNIFTGSCIEVSSEDRVENKNKVIYSVLEKLDNILQKS